MYTVWLRNVSPSCLVKSMVEISESARLARKRPGGPPFRRDRHGHMSAISCQTHVVQPAGERNNCIMTTTTDVPSTPPPAPESRKSGGGKRIFKLVVLAVIVVIAVALVALYLNLNSIVRRTVEKQSTASLNLKTELESANVSLFGGKIGLRNFKLDSPAGFMADDMMSLG